MENDLINAKTTFLNFMKVMKEWEENTFKMDFTEPNQEKAKKEISIIFDKYCTKKDRKYGKEYAISVSAISNYDISTQPIYKTEKIKNKIFFYTKQTNKAGNDYRYTFLKKEDIWLLDKKEVSYNNGDKWEKSII